MSTGELLGRLEGHTGWIDSVEYAPDGSSLVTSASDATVRLWDRGGLRARRIHRAREPVPDARFSADGQSIWFVDGDGLVQVEVAPPAAEDDPRARLAELESRAGVRLQGLELVPDP